MNNSISKVNDNFSITHGDELKSRKFWYNTIREYQIGCYLQNLKEDKSHLTLHVDFVQSKGDFSLNQTGFELKENPQAIKHGDISFEIANTEQCKVSGILESYKNKVKYFVMYFPVLKNKDGSKQWYSHDLKEHKDKLVIFDTNELFVWLKSKPYITAKHNMGADPNAICWRVPVNYLSDNSSFQSLIKSQYTVPLEELESFGKPPTIEKYFRKSQSKGFLEL